MSSSFHVFGVLLAIAFLLGNTIAYAGFPLGMTCSQEFRSVDDQADIDIREVDQLIGLLESELGDTAIASGDAGLKNHLHARLEAARTRRADLLKKQHNDLNAIRARCDRLR